MSVDFKTSIGTTATGHLRVSSDLPQFRDKPVVKEPPKTTEQMAASALNRLKVWIEAEGNWQKSNLKKSLNEKTQEPNHLLNRRSSDRVLTCRIDSSAIDGINGHLKAHRDLNKSRQDDKENTIGRMTAAVLVGVVAAAAFRYIKNL